jgi:hypothetical protein
VAGGAKSRARGRAELRRTWEKRGVPGGGELPATAWGRTSMDAAMLFRSSVDVGLHRVSGSISAGSRFLISTRSPVFGI